MSAAPGGALPRAAAPFVAFPTVLRENGFAVAPDQTIAFLEAVALLGPRSMRDVYRASVATLAPPPERREEYDALFRAFFHGQTVAAAAAGGEEEEDEIAVHEPRGGVDAVPEGEEPRDVGGEATPAEVLSVRRFAGLGDVETLRRFRRAAPARLPRRTARRRRTGARGPAIDMRRALREATRRDGEVVELPRRVRRRRQRRILLLVDISGSMKGGTEGALAFAHALTQVAERCETFTFGTRLTRVTRALKLANAEQALALAGTLAPDWDGGTRIGDALTAFLSVPRFAGFARGALVVVLSDGLERGSPDAMVAAVAKLSRLAWRLHWLTPLAAEPGFAPRTAALSAALPFIDELADGSGLAAVCEHVLDVARAA